MTVVRQPSQSVIYTDARSANSLSFCSSRPSAERNPMCAHQSFAMAARASRTNPFLTDVKTSVFLCALMLVLAFLLVHLELITLLSLIGLGGLVVGLTEVIIIKLKFKRHGK